MLRARLAAVACVLLAVPAAAPAQVVVPLRSIDPGFPDDADLEPLARAIGDARVVMLGEASHGDGAAHAAKARVFRFLRERMAFDVVVFEAGMADAHAMDRALEEGIDLTDAAPLGLPAFWLGSAWAMRVIEDAWTSYFGERPVSVAGFATEITGRRAAARWPRDVLDALASIEPHPIGPARRRELLTVTERLEAAEAAGDDAAVLLAADDLADLAATVRAHAGALDAALGPIAAQRLVLVVDDRAWEAGLTVAGDVLPPGEMASYADRERRMASNLRWLLESVHPDRRVVVWCANWRLLARPEEISASPRPEAVAGSVSVRGLLGGDVPGGVFTLAFSSVDGLTGWPDQPGVPVPLALEDGLESVVAREGGPFAFVHLSALPPGHELRRPRVARLAGLSLAMRAHGDDDLRLTADWGGQVDGLIVVRTMFPATRDGKGPDGAPLTLNAAGEGASP